MHTHTVTHPLVWRREAMHSITEHSPMLKPRVSASGTANVWGQVTVCMRAALHITPLHHAGIRNFPGTVKCPPERQQHPRGRKKQTVYLNAACVFTQNTISAQAFTAVHPILHLMNSYSSFQSQPQKGFLAKALETFGFPIPWSSSTPLSPRVPGFLDP